MKFLLGFLLLAFASINVFAQGNSNPPGNRYVRPATFFFDLDEEFVEGVEFLIKMEDERDTPEYRKRAFDWFKSQHNLDIPADVKHNDLLFDGKAIMTTFRVNPAYRMNVVAADVQDHPRWRGRFPINNAQMIDDGYLMVVLEEGLTVRGNFSEEYTFPDYEVPVGSFILYGEYRLFTDGDCNGGEQKFQTAFQYQSDYPVTPSPFPPFASPIRCTINHPDFGRGLNDGRTLVLPNRVKTVYRIAFPLYLSDLENRDRPKDAERLGDYN